MRKKTQKITVFFSVLVLGLLMVVFYFSVTQADSVKPFLMVSLGDSLTAGTFANAPLQKGSGIAHKAWGPSPIDLSGELKEWFDHQFSDGYTVANKAKLSWASGSAIASHYQFLKNYLKNKGETTSLEVLNFAFPRDTTAGLENQVRQLIEVMHSGKYASIQYITLMIGSNDVCAREKNTKIQSDLFRKNMMNAFEKIAQIKQDDPIRILMVGIPNITQLGSEQIRKLPHPFGRDCGYVRNHVLHFCDSMLTWQTPDELLQKESLIQERNQILEEIAAEIPKRFPHLQISFTRRLSSVVITPDLLAMDCFHLDQAGQVQLSEELWKEQPWFGY